MNASCVSGFRVAPDSSAGGLNRRCTRSPVSSVLWQVRLLGSVHNPLRLEAVPMRAGSGNAAPVRPESVAPMAHTQAASAGKGKPDRAFTHANRRTCTLADMTDRGVGLGQVGPPLVQSDMVTAALVAQAEIANRKTELASTPQLGIQPLNPRNVRN
jgi:hypothetical protein